MSGAPWTRANSRAAAPPRASRSVAATTTLWLPSPAISSPARPSTRAIAAMRSVSSSTWFAGGNVDDGGRAAPCRATIRRASHGATAPIRKRLPNEQITSAGTNRADVPFGGSQTTTNASSTVTTRNSGQRHAPRRRHRIRRAQNPPAVLTPPAYFRPAASKRPSARVPSVTYRSTPRGDPVRRADDESERRKIPAHRRGRRDGNDHRATRGARPPEAERGRGLRRPDP